MCMYIYNLMFFTFFLFVYIYREYFSQHRGLRRVSRLVHVFTMPYLFIIVLCHSGCKCPTITLIPKVNVFKLFRRVSRLVYVFTIPYLFIVVLYCSGCKCPTITLILEVYVIRCRVLYILIYVYFYRLFDSMWTINNLQCQNFHIAFFKYT